MAAIERNMQEEEQFSGDDDSNSFVQNLAPYLILWIFWRHHWDRGQHQLEARL